MRNLIAAAALVLFSMAGCGEEYDATPDPRAKAGNGGVDKGGHAGEPGEPEGGADSTAAGAGGAGSGGDAGAGGSEAGSAGAGGAGEEPPSTTVHGKLRNGLLPIPGAVVLVNGESALTNQNGEYAFENVAPTYQLIFIVYGSHVINIYDGLTTRQPVTNLPDGQTTKAASVTGKLSGGAGMPVPAEHGAAVAFAAKEGATFQTYTVPVGESSYVLGNLAWVGGDTLDGELKALQWKNGVGGPESYTGFGSKLFTLQAGESHGAADGSTPATNLALSDVEDETLSGAITLGDTLSLTASGLYVDRLPVPVALAAGAFSLVVPKALPATIALDGQAADGGSSHAVVSRPEADAWNIDLPKPPQLVLPVADAQGVTIETEFKWSDVPAGIVTYITWGLGDWTVALFTTETTATIPDLSDQGIEYASGVSGAWELKGSGPAATVDELMALEDELCVTSQPFSNVRVQSASRTLQLAD